MAKTIKFADGKAIEFTDGSTPEQCTLVAKSFAEVDTVRAEFTEANLKGATFDGKQMEYIVPVGAAAETDGENVVAYFTNRVKGQVEINAEQISELQEALATIVEGA